MHSWLWLTNAIADDSGHDPILEPDLHSRAVVDVDETLVTEIVARLGLIQVAQLLADQDRLPARLAESAHDVGRRHPRRHDLRRSEEHTSELQSLMRHSYAVFCL